MFVRMTLCFAILAVGFFAAPLRGELLVSDNFGHQVLRFDEATGAPLGVLVTPGSAELNGATGMMIGPDNRLWVASQNSNSILRYDLYDGAFVSEFASSTLGNNGSLMGPSAIEMVGDEVWVSNFAGNTIERFNPITGESLGPATSGGVIAGAPDFTFGPDGFLYVSSFGTNEVLKFDGTTHEFIEALPTSPALVGPATIAFHNGKLHVASLLGQTVQQFNAESNSFQTFASPPPFGENQPFPSDLLFRGNQMLVTLTGLASVAGFDATTGTQTAFFAAAPTLQVPGRMLIAPAWIPGDANGDGGVDILDFAALRTHFNATGGRRQGDFTGDQKIDLTDFALLRANFNRESALVVPEPSTLTAGACAIAMFFCTLRRPRRSMS